MLFSTPFNDLKANACLTHLPSLMVPRKTLSPFRNQGPSRIPPIKVASNKGCIGCIILPSQCTTEFRMSTPSSSLGAFTLILQHRHLTDWLGLPIYIYTITPLTTRTLDFATWHTMRLGIRAWMIVKIDQDVFPYLLVQSKVRCHIKAGWSAALILDTFANSLSHTSAQGNQ